MIEIHKLQSYSGAWLNKTRWGKLQLAIMWYYFRDANYRLKFVPNYNYRGYTFFYFRISTMFPAGRWVRLTPLESWRKDQILITWYNNGSPMPDISRLEK